MQETNSFIERLANTTLTGVSSKIIFSDPIEKHGVTVIPVSKMSFGYGLGGGYQSIPDNENKKEGCGIGLGVIAQPIGYIKIDKESVTFEPIRRPVSIPYLVLASGIAGYLFLRAAAKLFR